MKKLYVTSALAALLATTAFADNAAPAEPVKAAEAETTGAKVEKAAETVAKDVEKAAVKADKAEKKVSDAADAKKDEPKASKKHKADATHEHAAPEAKKAKTSHHTKAHKGIPADAAELNGSTTVWNMPTASEIAKEDADCKKACEGHKKHHDAKHAEAAKAVEAHDAPKTEAVEVKADAKTASHG